MDANKLPELGLIKLFEVSFPYLLDLSLCLLSRTLTVSLQAFYAFSRYALIHQEEFGGGLNHQLANFQQMKSQLHDLEENLKAAILERDEALQNKVEAIKVHEITRDDLNKATDQVTMLSLKKERLVESNANLGNTVSQLKEDLSSLHESLAKKNVENTRLGNVIQVIEKEKLENFEMGLVLARWHTENFPG